MTNRAGFKLIVASCLVPGVLGFAGCAQAKGTRYRRHLSVVIEPAPTDAPDWPEAARVTLAEPEQP